jgi:hypothetical protein
MRSPDFNPEPVRTSTVVCVASIVPARINCVKPAAAAAEVGST